MAEAIAAFSLAANIVQFIDFGCNFVSIVWSIHRKGRDGSGELFDLDTTTKDLQLVLMNLQLPIGDADEKTESERSLQELAGQCQNLATEMLNDLRKIRIPDKARKRDALKTAFRMIWNEDEIKSQQGRLEGFKHQITLHLLGSLREQGRKSLYQQELVISQVAAVHEGTTKLEGMLSQLMAEGIGAPLLDFITAKLHHNEKRIWHQDFIAAIYNDDENSITRDVSGLSISADRRETLQAAIIARLRYPGMEDRQERIVDAHEKTFQWIFDNQDSQEKRWSNFRDWLESDLQLYWITGKAGSGKSTLMKYICHEKGATVTSKSLDAVTSLPSGDAKDHLYGSARVIVNRPSRCEKYLKKWAAGSKLITATYFFWNSGVHMQMSKMGLLRSLLLQILQQCPALIPSVSPSRWEALCLFNDDSQEWTKQELEEMLRSVAEKISPEAKLCLFVDGLDEFDGRHDDLVCLFQAIISNRNVKVCVSSRPWVLFEDAFKHRPSLTLQDLTYPDIKHFVTSSFQEDSGFAQLRCREPEYADQLVENIVSKASGVFLWIQLVVASLLSGMVYGDRVSDLQRRLDLLPPDLRDLYEKILQSLDPFYLEHAAQLFKLVQESTHPPPLLLLSFADEESSEFALKQPVSTLARDDRFLRAETMRRRLNSRCKGLLEVGGHTTGLREIGEGTVQYLHRTVKDYIETVAVQDKLQSVMKSEFDPHLKLCIGNLSCIKAIDDSAEFLTDGTFWTIVDRCLYSASRIKPSNRGDVICLLDELDRTGRVLVTKMSKIRNTWPFLEGGRSDFMRSAGHWVSSHPLLSDSSFRSEFGCHFLSLAVRYGVVEYVNAKANHGCLVQRIRNGIWPLLRDATYVDAGWQRRFHQIDVSVEMIACLLHRGADPNFVTREGEATSLSVWGKALWVIFENFDGNTVQPPWEAIAGLMVEHKADISKTAFKLLLEKTLIMDNRLSRHMGQSYYEQKTFRLRNHLLAMKKAKTGSWGSWPLWPT